MRSPAHGQTNIPTTWSGNESPSPLPAGAPKPVGYPIMFVYSGGQTVVLRGAQLIAPGGAQVPIYIAPQQFEYDYHVIIPQRPLATNTTYHVRFDITVAGRWLTNEWDFSTGATIVGGGGSGGGAVDNGLHSAWVDQTALPAMQPAATQAVTLRFRNSGTKTWTKGVAGSQVALGINGDNTTFSALGMNVGWPSANRVAVQTEAAVPPGGIASFTFVVKAPFSGGLVQIPLRPVDRWRRMARGPGRLRARGHDRRTTTAAGSRSLRIRRCARARSAVRSRSASSTPEARRGRRDCSGRRRASA